MNKRCSNVAMFLVGTLVTGIVTGAARGMTLTESFSGTTLNSTYWQFVTTNATASVDDGLIIDIPANPTAGWYAGIRSKFPLTGDFDVQVDYNLGASWTNLHNYGVAVGLSDAASGMTVYRFSSYEYYLGVIPKDRYYASASGNYYQSDTLDTQGKLRFRRTTEPDDNWGAFRAYYWDTASTNWHQIMSRSHQSGDETLFVGAWALSGGSIAAPLQITFSNLIVTVQTAPTDIALSNAMIEENRPSGTTVGVFSSTDLDTGDTFTYTLVSGSGSTNNGSFTISGSNLLTAASFNYEVKSNYSIRVRSADQGGLSTQKVFAIDVTDANEIPVFLGLAASTGTNVVFRWSSVTNHLYAVRFSTNLTASFSTLKSNITATPVVNSYTDSVQGVLQKFWQITTDP